MVGMSVSESGRPATKGDVQAVWSELRAVGEGLNARLNGVQGEARDLRSDLGAVKSDLAEVKGDLGAVRDELKESITRQDAKIDSKTDKIWIEVVKGRGRMEQMEEGIEARAAARHSEMIGIIDSFARKGESYDRKSLSHGDQLQGHEARLRDHDRRLGRLEES